VAFGRLHVAPRMPRFLDLNPEVQVELVMSDNFVDLIGEAVDLAVRVGEIADPTLIAKRIGITRRVTVASRGYLERRGEPLHPADLAAHDCILYTRLATGNEWHFAGSNGDVVIRVQGRYLADNSEGVREGVLGGLGVGVIPVWLFKEDEIARGEVRIILRDFEPTSLPIHAVYPSRRLVPTKVRAMIEFLASEFGRDPLLSDRSFGHAALTNSRTLAHGSG
jgi:DNA-binding transcriptional LysR family regulator